ncbi:putative IMP-specific 5'-nucleotidase 1 [Toxoplasma gondii CAST]|uniref:IMP-specific 5'-nucleotidase 1 n=1 Tax=Toxoplasma gondii CAST TaxID=943122 RepID=A0A3R7YWP6_TOXGO|nr:putative IMP-specific 5'-nucleotidase 1 [Toxoplasma gondii CAST]
MAPPPEGGRAGCQSCLSQNFQHLPHHTQRDEETPSPKYLSHSCSSPGFHSDVCSSSSQAGCSSSPSGVRSPASPDVCASPGVCASPSSSLCASGTLLLSSRPFCLSSGAAVDGSSTGSWRRETLDAVGGEPGRRKFAANHFLPLLTELFVALFKARCFASLVVRVLQAIEDEIVVEEAFVPYITTPRSSYARSGSGAADRGDGSPGEDGNSSRGDAAVSPLSLDSGDKETFDGDPRPQESPSETPDASPLASPTALDAATASKPTCGKKCGAGWPLFCPPTVSSFASVSLHLGSVPLGGSLPAAAFEAGPGCMHFRHSLSAGSASLGGGPGRQRPEGVMPFFTKLRLVAAFQRVDARACMTKRKVVPPSFHECREILNLAQILESRSQLRLVTMDGDETLYPDGANFTDERIARHIAALLRRGTKVAVVTAAGYGYETARYEERLGVLFEFLRKEKMPAEAAGNFYVMGGESNYLMKLSPALSLEPVDEALWTSFRPSCHPRDADRLLDIAEAALRSLSEELKLPACILRKARAVGLIRRQSVQDEDECALGCGSGDGMRRENLEEIVMRVRRTIRDEFGPHCMVPWSAFNGGNDVWVDIGNKAEGVALLQGLFQLFPRQCLHIGDQFGTSGNDLPARVCSPTAWVANPQETAALLHELLQEDKEEAEIPPRGDSKRQETKQE